MDGDRYKKSTLFRKWLILSFCIGMALALPLRAQNDSNGGASETLTVGVAGTPPFVAVNTFDRGISTEIWRLLASRLGWEYRLKQYEDVPEALQALQAGEIDVVVGPVSITSDRAERVKFTQPYYQSSLSILSRTDGLSLWNRISPFFSKRFFIALFVFLLILGGVGTLLWIAERERNSEQFPHDPIRGIANGMWCAIVTMSTTGYGDKAPATLWGRIIAGSWMVVSIIFATTMVAGIASTLTLTGMNATVIATADALKGKKVAVVSGSPAEVFVKNYGGIHVGIDSLQEGYDLLKSKKADAVVYDRPQILFFLKQRHDDESVAVSTAEYIRQGYGFALPLNTTLLHSLNVTLLSLKESGSVERIADEWLGAGE